MRINVNPTRMELRKLKSRLVLARRGHKLLKDKQDELMRNFVSIFNDVKDLRNKVGAQIKNAQAHLTLARSNTLFGDYSNAVKYPDIKFDLNIGSVMLLNLRPPAYKLSVSGNPVSYAFSNTSSFLDKGIIIYANTLQDMVFLAEKEKTFLMVAREIERTRRRVNALEYILIPNLVETIKYISMRLAEAERSDLTRLMKIKDMVRSH